LPQETPKSADIKADSTDRRFAEELLRFCERAYEVERGRKEEMEKKAQYYLALITGLLGILALKGGVLELKAAANFKLLTFLRSGLGLLTIFPFLLAILSALFCMIKVLAPREYEKPYPNNLLTFLFRASSRFKTDAELIRAQAEELAWAAEINFKHNLAKSVWLSRLSKCVFAILLLLLLLLVVTNV
jgi:hypothetical protein